MDKTPKPIPPVSANPGMETQLVRDVVRLLMQLGFSKKQIIRYLYEEHQTPLAKTSINNLVSEAKKRDQDFVISPSLVLSHLKPFLAANIRNLPYPENTIVNYERASKQLASHQIPQCPKENKSISVVHTNAVTRRASTSTASGAQNNVQ